MTTEAARHAEAPDARNVTGPERSSGLATRRDPSDQFVVEAGFVVEDHLRG
jgi:hypothetical protein